VLATVGCRGGVGGACALCVCECVCVCVFAPKYVCESLGTPSDVSADVQAVSGFHAFVVMCRHRGLYERICCRRNVSV
jgi:hypothetical protein